MLAILKRVDRDGERWLLLSFYGMIVATIGVEVIRRFVFSYSSIWGEEVARYAFIYLAWIGASAAVRDRAHIRIDIIIQWLPPRGKAFIYLLGDFATLLLAVVVLIWSMHPVMTSLKFEAVSHGLRLNMALFQFAVPFGFALVTLRVIQSILRDFSDLRAGRPVFEGRKLFD
ncbi:MAG: TRAP transporter small permease [Gammaproteobacteria bacterium]|nr:TRAP transporter small permease [Gammaproteobacteria bacterium]